VDAVRVGQGHRLRLDPRAGLAVADHDEVRRGDVGNRPGCLLDAALGDNGADSGVRLRSADFETAVKEVGVAFPNDETSGQIIADRLRAAGILARVDRGLYGSYQSGPRGQITVLVAEQDAEKARAVVAARERRRIR